MNKKTPKKAKKQEPDQVEVVGVAAKMRRDYLIHGEPKMAQEPSPRFTMIARKMMRGLTKGTPPTQEQFDAFKEKHKSAIVWTDTHMPRQLAGRAISMGVLGAIGKGVLWFGREKMEPFCQALGKGDFNGAGDPAHILWLWLTGRAKYNCDIAYRKTVAAIRSYVVGKQLMRVRDGREEIGHFAPAETDLFEWDSTFTMMLKRHSNTSRKMFAVPSPDGHSAEGPSEEELRLAEEVEEAMASMR